MQSARHKEPGFLDVWLRRELSLRYDETLKESLPDEVMQLLSGTLEHR